MSWNNRVSVVLVAAVLAACGLDTQADVLVLEDPLQGSTCGVRNGGAFSDGGWKIIDRTDWIYWHLDGGCALRKGTVYKGKMQFRVKGLNPNECRSGLKGKSDLFHMYDYTYGNADTDYSGYRNNPFKHFIRKNGCSSSYNNTIDAFELVLVIAPNYQEPDTRNLNWNPAVTYLVTEEWGPDGQGNCVFKTYRDGILEREMTEPGSWSPLGHSVRIGLARIDKEDGAPIDAVFSDLKVWDTETALPSAPVVTWPGAGKTINERNPRIRWAWTPTFNRYQVRVTTGNSPTTGIVWDSGEVISVKNYADTPQLANLTNYYVWVRLGNVIGWTDWSASGQWRVDTSYTAPNNGVLRLVGNSLHDNQGPFLGQGFTYMEGLGFCKHDHDDDGGDPDDRSDREDRFESDLAFMSSKGFNYMRILSEVPGACPQDYWYGRSINASTYWCEHLDPNNPDHEPAQEWPDYDDRFRDMVDIAYDRYGMRTEVTIFGGAGESFPTYAGREAHCQRILNLVAGREHKIAYIEIANEAWQTGFSWPQGREDLRALCKYVADRTTIPVAITSMNAGNAELMDLYLGSAADIATEHFDRNTGTFEGGWRPVRDCWRVQDAVLAGVPPVSSDEPIGPGSSVSTEDDPIKLVSAACFAWIAKLPAYVLHSRAGVRGDYRFEDMAGVNNFKHLREIMPPDMAKWIRNDGIESSAPFTVYCNGQANKYWTDIPSVTDGCHRNIGGTKCSQFVCYPQGIRSGGLTLLARQAMNFTVYNPLTGEVVDTITLDANESLHLSQGPGAYIIKGTFAGIDPAPPAQAVKFAANPGDGQIDLTWRNPIDGNYWGTKIVYRTDRYPTSVNDGVLVCENRRGSGASEWYTHTGLANGVTCYYAAVVYDCAATPNYSVLALAEGTPREDQCHTESFTYPNGNLNGNRGWNGSAGPYIRIANDVVAIEGGATVYDAVHPISCQSSSTGHIRTSVKVRKGVGQATMWGLWFDDPSGKNLARWYGSGTTARGRIAGTSSVTPEQTLTGDWDHLVLKINPVTRTSEFILNGTSIGALDYSVTGASSILGRVRFERIDNGNAAGHYLHFDELKVGDPRAPGDFNGDEDVDQEDFGHLQMCLSGDGTNFAPDCQDADLDLDGDVDGVDVVRFIECMNGPGQTSPCAP